MSIETSVIELRPVTRDHPEDVEYLRTVRNSFLDQNVYADNHFIEAEEHRNWFASLDDSKDFFFIIFDKATQMAVGITGCYQKKAPAGSGEISIYIMKENKSLTVPFHAMAALLRFMFETLRLERAFGLFYKANHRAIRFNASFGFRQFSENEHFIKTELSAAEFAQQRERLSRFL